MNVKAVSVVIGIMLSTAMLPSFAQTKETVIQEKNGATTTVKTDSNRTTTTTNGKTVYTGGGDRHKDQVDYSTKQGGKVVSEKSTSSEPATK